MHPIERLRYVARAGHVPLASLVRESAGALSAFSDDTASLLTSCRQLVARRPACAPLVWLAARMLTGPDPRAEAWDSVEEFERDATWRELEHALPEAASVLTFGSNDISGQALRERTDVLIVDADQATAAVHGVELVLIESDCIGPTHALVPRGAAEAIGHSSSVWLICGVGRALPEPMWSPALESFDANHPLRDMDVMNLDDSVDYLVTTVGLRTPDEARRRIDCPVVPELFRGR